MSYLIDTYALPSDSELKMSGCLGCMRYVSHTSGKNVTKAQVSHIHSLGKNVVLNFEDNATNAKGGHSQGVTDAKFALGVAQEIGAPKGIAIYFSVDYEIHSGFATVENYFAGVRSVLDPAGYLTGLYGDYDLTEHMNGKVHFTWQTAAWSYGKRDTNAEFLQDVFTNAYDKDEIEKSYYGGWTPNGAQKPGSVSPTDANWSDMATQAQVQAAAAAAIRAEIPAIVKAVWSTDNIVPAPSNAPSYSKNKFWAPGTHLTQIAEMAGALENALVVANGGHHGIQAQVAHYVTGAPYANDAEANKTNPGVNVAGTLSALQKQLTSIQAQVNALAAAKGVEEVAPVEQPKEEHEGFLHRLEDKIKGNDPA